MTDTNKVLKKLQRDKKREEDRLSVLTKHDINKERQVFLKGLIQGLDWSIRSFKITA